MKTLIRLTFAILVAGSLLLPVTAQDKERDIFNYVAQKAAAKDVKKIVFIADTSPHGGPGNHEFMAGAILMARTLNAHYPNAYAVVHPHTAWPKDLSHADSVIVLLNHGGPAVNPAVKAATARGAGFAAIHYGVEVNKGEQGDHYLKWIGGYFEVNWSVNPHWVADIKKIPEHEINRGVKPFTINDEWYYHMRFVEGMKGVTPILSALPARLPDKKTSARGGNPDVYEEVKAGKEQHLAWAFVRPDGARGFGFTGYHNYINLQNDNFRTVLLNAVAWTSKLDVPTNGVPSKTPTKTELDELFKEALRFRK